jgi:2'-hydroxyisoflavone reductase
MAISNARAEEAGLSHRPLEETVADSLAWQAVRRGWSQRWLDRPRELQLLREWRG